MQQQTTGIRIDRSVKARLSALGKEKDRSSHYLMKEAIAQYLEREEAKLAEARLLDERWKEYQLTGETISHDAVTEWANNLGTEKEFPCPLLK